MSFEFVAGNLALDFVATVAERTTTHLERLQTGADLADWIVQAHLLDAPPAVSQGDLAAAKQLREALFRLVTTLTEQAPLPEADRRLVNRFAAAAPPTLSVTADARVRRGGGVAETLAALARAGIELFDQPDTALVRWCADARCTRPFIDRSRGQRRRWCGMAGCGDRAKAAAYRQRQRQRQRQRASPTQTTPQGSSGAGGS